MFITNEIIFKELNNSLLSSTDSLADVIKRLSTGFKVKNAQDSPADYAIITDLKTKISSLDVAHSNIEHGMNLLSATEDTLNNILSLMKRIRELALSATNGTYGQKSLDAIQQEINSCSDEISNLNSSLEFNGIKVFQDTKTLNKNKSYIDSYDGALEEINTIALSVFSSDNNISTETENNDINKLAKTIKMLAPLSLDESPYTDDLTLQSGESIDIILGGNTYSFFNENSGENTISYSYNATTDLLTIDGEKYTLISNDDISKKLTLNTDGAVYIQLGSGNNNVTTNGAGEVNIIAGDGDNIIKANCLTNLTLGDGNNNITFAKKDSSAILGSGTNTLNLKENSIINTAAIANLNITMTSGKTLSLSTDGKKYTLSNATSFSVNYDSALKFTGKNLKISTASEQVNNIILASSSMSYTDNLGATTIDIKGTSSQVNLLNAGNNTVNINANSVKVNTGEGIDTVNINGNNSTITTGSGNDIITVNGSTAKVDAGEGDDNILVNGINSEIIGNLGNNYIELSASATGGTVYTGEKYDSVSAPANTNSATNTLIVNANDTNICLDNSINNVTVNGNSSYIYNGNQANSITLNGDNGIVNHNGYNSSVVTDNGLGNIQVNKLGESAVLPDSGSIEIRAGESFDITIAGKTYTISNNMSGSGTLTYSYDSADDIITFTGVGDEWYQNSSGSWVNDGETLDITAKSGQIDKVRLNGTFGNIYLGDGDDYVESSINKGKVYTEAGADTVKITNGTRNSSTYTYLTYDTGTENDTVEASADTNYLRIFTRDGNDTVDISGDHNLVYGGNGADTLRGHTPRVSTMSHLYGEAGDDTLYSDGRYDHLYGGDGADNITIDPYYADASVDTYALVDGQAGDDIITINGVIGTSGYVSGGADKDTIYINNNVNSVLGASGDDKFIIKNGMQAGQIGLIDGGVGNDTIEANLNLSQLNTVNIEGINEQLPNAAYISVAAGDEQILDFGTHKYTVKNTTGSDRTFRYTFNASTKSIIFHTANYLEIHAGNNQVDNVTMNYSGNNKVYLGNEDDTITVNAHNSTNYTGNSIYGGDGADTFNINSSGINVYGEAGEDTINMNSSTSYTYTNAEGYTISGGADNDTINVYTKNNTCTFAGDEGDDLINMVGQNYEAIVKGGEGSDTLKQEYDVKSSEFETIYRNTKSNTSAVLIDANVLTNVYINDKLYQFHSENAQKIFTHHASSGQLLLDMDNTTVTVMENENQNISLVGMNNTYNGNNYINKVRIGGSNNIINGGDANDEFTIASGAGTILYGNNGEDKFIINSANNSAYGGAGVDTITLSKSTNKTIDGEDDNDIININASGSSGIITGGAGDDTINITGSNNTKIQDSQGADTITVKGSSNNISTEGGIKTVTLQGNSNTYNGSNNAESNIVSVLGSTNTVNGGQALDIINITSGSDNNILTNDGDDVITLDSSNNNINSGVGNDILYINSKNEASYTIDADVGDDILYVKSSNSTGLISGGADSDTFILQGTNNTSIETGTGDDFIHDYASSNSVTNSMGDDIYASNGAYDSIINGINKVKLNEAKGSFIIANAGESVNISTKENALYNIITTENNTEVEYLQKDANVILGVDHSEINTMLNEMSNFTVEGSDNIINLSDSIESNLSAIGNNNVINANNGNYDINLQGNSNTINLTQGESYIEISHNSKDNIINGNNAKTTVMNTGTATVLNNCDKLISSIDDILLQVGIHGDDYSQISVSTGMLLGRLSFNVQTEELAQNSLERLDSLIEKVTREAMEIGAQYSRLSSALEVNEIEQLNHISAKSTLQDADVTELTSEYVKNILIQQSSSILLTTTSNFKTDMVLKLLKAI